MNAFDLVTTAAAQLFSERNVSAADECFADSYIQHSALAEDGIAGLKALVNNLPENFRYEPARVIADDTHVVLHGTYYGFGDVPLVAFDIFRVEEGKIVEHWDALTPEVENTVSGNSQTDGAKEVVDEAKTAANKQLIQDFVDQVLIGADYSVLTDFISTESYIQHNPEADNGLAGYGTAAQKWGAEGKVLAYKKLHQIVAQGNFVFTRAEGEFGVPVAYNDLWRIEDGTIVEHWDVIVEVPAKLPHANGIF